MKTETREINGKIYKIKVRIRTHMRNFCGYYVWIDDVKYFANVLYREEAIASAVKRHTKEEK